MKLARYSLNGKFSVGKIEGNFILDAAAVVALTHGDVSDILNSRQALAALQKLVPDEHNSIPLNKVKLEAPIIRPEKFLALGMNYKDHEEEARKAGVPIPTSQVWFNKQVSCINGPFNDICYPSVCERLDYEAELGVVIGKGGRYISEADALEHVAGYFVANDISSRDWQAKSPTWTLGKSFDTHGPIGPWIVTTDEIPDPQDLNIRLSVNGELRQQSSTALMTYSVAKQIAPEFNT